MLRILLTNLLVATALCVASAQAAVVTNFTSVSTDNENWKTLTTPHFKVHFTPEQEKWAYYAANIAEVTHQKLSQELDWNPQDHTHMVLTDDYDFSNGWATTIPFQNVRLFLSPPDNLNTLEDYDDWLKLLIVHEYTHILHMDKVGGFYKVMRKIFGRNAFFFPNAWQPTWIIEGLATHKETDHSSGYGRGQNSNYNMRMRSEVIHGIKDIQAINAHAREWPFGSAYLYGTYFMAFITEKYGQEALDKYIKYYSRNVIPYWLNPRARRAFDKDFLQLWDEFKVALHQQFAGQIAQLKQQGISQGSPLDAVSLGAVSGEFYNTQFYFIQSSRTQPTMLKRIDSQGNIQPVTKLYQVASFDINKQGEVLVAQVRKNSDNRYYSDLYLVNSSGANNKLTSKQRWREGRWMDSQRILARRSTNGFSELAIINRDGRFVETLWRGQPGEVLGQFDYHPQRKMVVAQLKKPGLDWDIYRFDFKAKQWQPLLAHQGIEAEPKFSSDGSKMLFTADYDGDFNSYQFDLSSKQVTQLTRSDTGIFAPVNTANGLYFFRYANQGYELRNSATPLALATQPRPQINASYSYDFANKPEYSTTSYSAWESLRPHHWFPIGMSDESYSLFGVTTSGNDALGKHNYLINIMADFEHREVQADLTYQYSNKWLARVYRELDYFSENDEVYAITAENGADLIWMNLFSGLDGNFSSHLGGNWSRTTLVHDEFNQFESFAYETAIAGISFVFDNREAYVDTAGAAWGHKIVLKAGTFDIVEDDLEGHITAAHWSHHWGFSNGHVISLKAEAGYSEANWINGDDFEFRLGGKQSPVSAFYFDQDEFNLRGFDDNQFYGYLVQTNSLEWRMPLSRVERTLNMFPIGIQDIYGTLFVDSGAVWSRDAINSESTLGSDYYGNYHTGIGAELLIELNLGFRAVVPLTLGAAKGFGDYGDDEFYLSFGYSF